MAIGEVHRKAIEEVIVALTTATAGGRGKRLLADMFLDLPDRDAWSEYYEVIPEPRCIRGVRLRVEKTDRSGYSSALDVYDDLSLVFLNAVYYNEDGSQIWKDANTLKGILEAEWKKRPVLPTPRASPPPLSAQKAQQNVTGASLQAKSSSSKPQTQSQAAATLTPSTYSAPAVAPATKPAAETPAAATRRASVPMSATSIAPVAANVMPVAASTTTSSAHDMDGDVDVGGGPSDNDGEIGDSSYGEPMAMAENMARDAQSDDIVHQLERGLPRWEGYGELGWIENVDLDKCADIVHAIKTHKDVVSNTRLASVLDTIPEDAAIKNLSFNCPLSLKIIETKTRSKEYNTSIEFDKDMVRLFEKGRRWYESGTDQYGDVLLLQRLYQALTSPSPPIGPPYASQTNFSSIRAGPGTARPVHGSAATDVDLVSGVTTFRISTKDRRFVDEVHYKGWTVRLADWLHLANPDDPNRPIIAQVFKCWVSEEPSKKGRPGVTACWYYRPEQTFHPVNRQFWEGEVFKTGHFADHPLEDIIEKIACQFTARHLRGRPRAPWWFPGWPLYVCDSRYNDRERVFVRIKNWASCVPEEVRKKPEWMRIYEFERAVVPRRVGSPFISGSLVKGRRGGRLPGGIGDAVERADGEKIEGGGTGRKRTRKSGAANIPPGPGPSRLPPGPGGVSLQAVSNYMGPGPYTTYNTQPQPQVQAQPVRMPTPRRTEDRGVIAAAGGPSILANAYVEKLPPETAKHFDRDPETNEVLWFPGPPSDFVRPSPPRYSLDYLYFLAKKRKQELQGEEASDADFALKRSRSEKAPPLTSELLEELWLKVFGGEQDVRMAE